MYSAQSSFKKSLADMRSKNSRRGDYDQEGNSTFEKIEKAILLAAQMKSKESSGERPLRDSSAEHETPNFLPSFEDTDQDSRGTLVRKVRPQLKSKMVSSSRHGKSPSFNPAENALNSQNYDLLDSNLEFGYPSRNQTSHQSSSSKRKVRAKITKKLTIELYKSGHGSSTNRESWGDKSRLDPLVIPLHSESNMMSRGSSRQHSTQRRNRRLRSGFQPLSSGDVQALLNKQNQKQTIISPVQESQMEHSPQKKGLRTVTPMALERGSRPISSESSKMQQNHDPLFRPWSAHQNTLDQEEAKPDQARAEAKRVDRKSKFDSYFSRKKEREANQSRITMYSQKKSQSTLGKQELQSDGRAVPPLNLGPTDSQRRRIEELREATRVEEGSPAGKNKAFIEEHEIEIEEVDMSGDRRQDQQRHPRRPRGQDSSPDREGQGATRSILVDIGQCAEQVADAEYAAQRSVSILENPAPEEATAQEARTTRGCGQVDSLVASSVERLLTLRHTFETRQSRVPTTLSRPARSRERHYRADSTQRLASVGWAVGLASSASFRHSSARRRSARARPLGRAISIKKSQDRKVDQIIGSRSREEGARGERSGSSGEEDDTRSPQILSQMSCIEESNEIWDAARDNEVDGAGDGEEGANKTSNAKEGSVEARQEPQPNQLREDQGATRRSRSKRATNKGAPSKEGAERGAQAREARPQYAFKGPGGYYSQPQPCKARASVENGESPDGERPEQVTADSKLRVAANCTKGLEALRQRRLQDIKQSMQNSQNRSQLQHSSRLVREGSRGNHLALEAPKDETNVLERPALNEDAYHPLLNEAKGQYVAFKAPRERLGGVEAGRSARTIQASIEQSSRYQTLKNHYSIKSLESPESQRRGGGKPSYRNLDLALTLEDSGVRASQKQRHIPRRIEKSGKKILGGRQRALVANQGESQRAFVLAQQTAPIDDHTQGQLPDQTTALTERSRGLSTTKRKNLLGLGTSGPSPLNRSQSDFSVKIRESLSKLKSIKEKASMDFVNERKMRLRRNRLQNASKTADEIASIQEEREPELVESKLRPLRSGLKAAEQQYLNNNSTDDIDLYEEYLQTYETEAGLRDTYISLHHKAKQPTMDEFKPNNLAARKEERPPKPPTKPKAIDEKLYASVPTAQRGKRGKASPSKALNLNLISPLNHSRKESTLVRILTTSVYGEPKMLHIWQTIQSQRGRRGLSRSPMEKERLRSIGEANNNQEIQRQMVQSHQVIYLLILKFLEGHDPVGPSIHIFKMALLNKKMMKLILNVYRIDDFQQVAAFEARQRMIRALSSAPQFEYYGSFHRSIKNSKAAWSNPVFGGSVLKPLRGAKAGVGGMKEIRFDGKAVAQGNPLKKYITTAPIDPDTGGGFYSLRNIRASANTFLDIEILIEGGIDSQADLKFLRELQAKSRHDRKNRFLEKSQQPGKSPFKPRLNQNQKPQIGQNTLSASAFQTPEKSSGRVNTSRIQDSSNEKSRKKFVPLANTQRIWTQGLRFASPQDAALSRMPANRKAEIRSSSKKQLAPVPKRVSPLSPPRPQDFTQKSDMKHLLTGVARIVEFGTTFRHEQSGRISATNSSFARDAAFAYDPTVDQKHNYIVSISEGQFVQGLFQGFSRCINAEGECYVGNWKKESESASRPSGKITGYHKDGSVKQVDGIYCGGELNANYLIKQKNMEKI